jgi:hypothetical protein
VTSRALWQSSKGTRATTRSLFRRRACHQLVVILSEPLEYVISVDDLQGSPAVPPGNLHEVAAELREMTKATKELNEIIRNASLEPA